MSRSASRARNPARDEDEDDDDEVPVRDRGEDLIRRRMKERKKAKKRASRRAERGETWHQAAGEEPTPSGERGDPFRSMPATPAAAGQSFHIPSGSRSASRAREYSSERHSSYAKGSGYFGQTHAVSTDSTSPTESTLPFDTDNAEEHRRATKAPSLLDEVVQEVVEEEVQSALDEDGEDDDEDDDDDAATPEEVTLRDRQDVSLPLTIKANR